MQGKRRKSVIEMKPVIFSPAAKRDWDDLPGLIQRRFGLGLLWVQQGNKPAIAKTLSGFGDAQVLELKDDDEMGTYRAVYTVRFEGIVYVLHAFQKKSKKGIATDKADLDLIKTRLKWAQADYAAWLKKEGTDVRP
jgi:phage-related protein